MTIKINPVIYLILESKKEEKPVIQISWKSIIINGVHIASNIEEFKSYCR